MNKQQLAAKIWASANQMRSKIEANEYKDYILGLIFYKYLSEKQTQFAYKEDWEDEDLPKLKEEDEETVKHFKNNLGYFISYDNLFSTWIVKGKGFNISNLRDALSAFNRLISDKHKKLFDGIFNTLETGLSKLDESAAKQTKAVNDLLELIQDIPMDGKQDYDVLGFIYEYLIGMFAANAGMEILRGGASGTLRGGGSGALRTTVRRPCERRGSDLANDRPQTLRTKGIRPCEGGARRPCEGNKKNTSLIRDTFLVDRQ